MKLEVEQKHRIEDCGAFVRRLRERGASLGEPIVQADQYFAHPSRDFAQTDEALRIRTVGGASFVTYKGPKLDATTKTRREIELPLAADDADGSSFAELLAALGFRPVATVRKTRRPFQFNRGGIEVHGALDEVDGVGTYVEFEVIADDEGLETAKRTVAGVAEELQLASPERRSYLEMLLERQGR